MPPLVRCKPFCGETDLSSHSQLELIVRNLQECKKLSDEYPDVAFINESV